MDKLSKTNSRKRFHPPASTGPSCYNISTNLSPDPSETNLFNASSFATQFLLKYFKNSGLGISNFQNNTVINRKKSILVTKEKLNMVKNYKKTS